MEGGSDIRFFWSYGLKRAIEGGTRDVFCVVEVCGGDVKFEGFLGRLDFGDWQSRFFGGGHGGAHAIGGGGFWFGWRRYDFREAVLDWTSVDYCCCYVWVIEYCEECICDGVFRKVFERAEHGHFAELFQHPKDFSTFCKGLRCGIHFDMNTAIRELVSSFPHSSVPHFFNII